MYGLSDRTESEALHIDLPQREPGELGSIVGSLHLHVVNATEEEEIERMDVHARIVIDIGNGEEIRHLTSLHLETCLFEDLPDHTLLSVLIVIHKTTGQVKGAFGRFLGTTGHQQFSFLVEDEGSRRSTRVLVIRKATVGTMPAQGVMDLKITTATLRTESEYF